MVVVVVEAGAAVEVVHARGSGVAVSGDHRVEASVASGGHQTAERVSAARAVEEAVGASESESVGCGYRASESVGCAGRTDPPSDRDRLFRHENRGCRGCLETDRDRD